VTIPVAQKLLAVIPARGGSKRLPRKNIRPLGGLPLIAYTITAALESGLFEQVLVSTDSPEIAEVSRCYGALVPFLRQEHLADDFTPVSAVTVDTLSRVDPAGRIFQSVAQLMPNCPLRTSADVLGSYHQFCRDQAQSQISVVRYGWQNPLWAMQRNAHNELAPLFPEQMTVRSQDQPGLFCPTGAIWWAKAEALRTEKTFHMQNRTGWEICWEHGIDIDTLEDWNLTELLFEMSLRQEAAAAQSSVAHVLQEAIHTSK
jgi:CMP-N-acetylneuraminic acid synthetase